MANKPLYIQIWEHYRKKIMEGCYKYGEAFPTERELENRHGCDRKTIRKALNLLVDEGLLVRIVGKGTFVCEPDMRLSIQSIAGFSDIMRQEGIHITTKVLCFDKIKAGYHVAKRMGIAKGSPLYKCIRVRYEDHAPVVMETAYIRDLFPGLEKYDFSVYSLFRVYESYGHKPTTVEENIFAVGIPETEAQILQKQVGDEVFLITDLTYDQMGDVIEYNRAYTISERFRVSANLT